MNLAESIKTHQFFSLRESDYIRWYPKSLSIDGDIFPDSVSLKPRGLYIHVPFCDKLCRFCPFNKRKTDELLLAAYVEALLREITVYSKYVACSDMQFIYFGGGSPSVLSETQLERIIAHCQKNFTLSSTIEISMECHPTHMSNLYLRSMKKVGVTRISTGIQSFHDPMLRSLGAVHSAKDATLAVEAAGDVYGELSIDLLYRCQEQDVDMWMNELEVAVKTGIVNHISCYSLILKNDRHQPSAYVDVDMAVEGYSYLCGEGYSHYASCASGGFDMCLEGKECVYEQLHWNAPQSEFLGLGPGALGFTAGRTTVNGLNIQRYNNALEKNQLPLVSYTHASEDEMKRRYFVLGMKTLEVKFKPFEEEFGEDPRIVFRSEFSELIEKGLATLESDALRVTDTGKFYVDTISSIFFSKDQQDVLHPEEPEIRAMEVQVIKNTGLA